MAIENCSALVRASQNFRGYLLPHSAFHSISISITQAVAIIYSRILRNVGKSLELKCLKLDSRSLGNETNYTTAVTILCSCMYLLWVMIGNWVVVLSIISALIGVSSTLTLLPSSTHVSKTCDTKCDSGSATLHTSTLPPNCFQTTLLNL